jgi:segregation and condensation protein A
MGVEERSINNGKVGQEEVHGLLFGEKLGWQAILYDLINTEQLDPWGIDINVLATKYLDKVRELEEHNFFVSSKVLLAAALLLRMKSEILLHEDIRGLDDILFGKKEEKSYKQERIELDDDIPDLIPRTPLPRARKVTLQELMSALGGAIKTENRRIKRIVLDKQHEMEATVNLPRQIINVRDRMRAVYGKLKDFFSKNEGGVTLSDFAGKSNEEKIDAFVPLLHLDHSGKVWLEQEGHFDEIWIHREPP